MKSLTLRIRRWLLVLVIVAVTTLFIARLMQLQIVEADAYRDLLNTLTLRTQTIKAVRGEITDRDGNLLAGNRMGYDVQIDRATFPGGRAAQNEVLYKLTELFRSLGESWEDTLPLSATAPFRFLEGQEDRVSSLKEKLGLQSYATADNVMAALREQYRLEDYSDSDARVLAAICYDMEQRDFGIKTPYKFAGDLDIYSVIQIRERSYDLPGVEVVESAVRYYEEGDLAPHIIGTIGAIYAEEYQELKEEGRIFQETAEQYDRTGYMLDDIIGKAGVEKAFEEYLRGQNGRRDVYIDTKNTVVDIMESISPEPGHTVSLTLDSHLQKTASEALEAQIKFLNENTAPTYGKEADSGAAAVVNVKTGEILAVATYPSYDLNTYRQDYATLAQDTEGAPLLNRAVNGEYTPGSIFKPAVSVAGLSNGIIDAGTRFNCGHVYPYGGFNFTCLGSHGSINVTWALHYSCNIFFYETGLRTGIDNINKAAEMLGLGVPTGIEIPEAPGQLSKPEIKEEVYGQPWYPGDVLQASIGQMITKLTPLQLANYAATIGNHGTRMKLTLVHEVWDYSRQELIQPFTPEVAYEMNMDPAVFNTIIEGMVSASHSGTAAGYFRNYPIRVASKTGTPETSDLCNSTFIAFAPADDPQIAVAVVIEKGWHGYTSAPVAKAVFDEYFGIDVNAPNPNGWDQLRSQRRQEAAAEEAARQQDESSSVPAGEDPAEEAQESREESGSPAEESSAAPEASDPGAEPDASGMSSGPVSPSDTPLRE